MTLHAFRVSALVVEECFANNLHYVSGIDLSIIPSFLLSVGSLSWCVSLNCAYFGEELPESCSWDPIVG